MEKKDNKLTRSEYLEIKRKAKADRKLCQEEIEKTPKNIEVLLDAFSSSYDGEARLMYRASFLIPNDSEFKEFYFSHGKSTNACIKYYIGTELGDIVTKIMCVERYGICDDFDLEKTEKLEYEEEKAEGTIDKETENKTNNGVGTMEPYEKTKSMFTPLEHLEMETTEVPVERPVRDSKENAVERQTEEALEKINHLFESHDTKEELIKKQADVISDLQEQNRTLKDENQKLKEEIEDFSVRVIGLEEENRALREQYQRIIKAIDQKYDEYNESHKKRV